MNEDETLDLRGSAVRRSFDGRYGGIFSYATSVEIEDAKKQVSALEEEKKKVEST